MSVLRQPLSRIASGPVIWTAPNATGGSRKAISTATKPWTCRKCRDRAQPQRIRITDSITSNSIWRRHITSTTRLRTEHYSSSSASPHTPVNPNTATAEANTPASSSTALPSQTANRRSDLSKRMSKILDELLVKASVASQHINAYTGTDYSGIEALRREIAALEGKVRDYHEAVNEAKAKHHEAHIKQTSAQREIVGLLERKSSWSPGDLERYMSLVRSEHLNDQDVQVARDNLAAKERELEDARSLLEKLERKQYHEEQVWSDTIRRNSTWLTFGLMGVNILLLLAQIAIFEPYRRKKIVRDVKEALDEKTLHATPKPVEVAEEVERQIDAAVPPSFSLERAEVDLKESLDSVVPSGEPVGATALAAGEVLPDDAVDVAGAAPSRGQGVTQPAVPRDVPIGTWEEYLRDLFSERLVHMRMVDVTNTALQGAATGVALMGMLFLLFRPR